MPMKHAHRETHAVVTLRPAKLPCHPSTSEESTPLSDPESKDAVPVMRWSSPPWERMDNGRHGATGKNSSTTAYPRIYSYTYLVSNKRCLISRPVVNFLSFFSSSTEADIGVSSLHLVVAGWKS
jgi:hypothetical protein